MPDWSGAVSYAVMPWMAIVYQLPWTVILIQLGLALLAALVVHRIGTPILLRLSQSLPFSRRLVRYSNRAGRLVVFLLLTQAILRVHGNTDEAVVTLRHVNALALTFAITWFALRCVSAIADTIIELNPSTAADNLRARRVQTQTRVLARSSMVLILVIGIAMALMTLPMMRQIGASLLASAGVAGLIIGFAAKPVLSNLLAGLQLALTQPISLADVVIINNEWGEIEEITGTYVVVKIWDQRRLIVPLQWFIENPFQNWTRTGSELLGTVLAWVDYRMPIALLRQEAERLCRDAVEWDGRLCSVQVVEAGDRAVQIRALVSAADASRCWDLRCKVREGLIDFVQREYPQYLPRLRTDLGSSEAFESDFPERVADMEVAGRTAQTSTSVNPERL